MHAPQHLISVEIPDFIARAQVAQRRTGWAKRVTQGSQTMPLLGQVLQTAHWLGIQFKSRSKCRCDTGLNKGRIKGRIKRLNIECQYTRSNTNIHLQQSLI